MNPTGAISSKRTSPVRTAFSLSFIALSGVPGRTSMSRYSLVPATPTPRGGPKAIFGAGLKPFVYSISTPALRIALVTCVISSRCERCRSFPVFENLALTLMGLRGWGSGLRGLSAGPACSSATGFCGSHLSPHAVHFSLQSGVSSPERAFSNSFLRNSFFIPVSTTSHGSASSGLNSFFA